MTHEIVHHEIRSGLYRILFKQREITAVKKWAASAATGLGAIEVHRMAPCLPPNGNSLMMLHFLIKTGPEAGQYFHVRPPIGFI